MTESLFFALHYQVDDQCGTVPTKKFRKFRLGCYLRKTLDNNDLNQVVASSGFSENKGLGGVFSLAVS